MFNTTVISAKGGESQASADSYSTSNAEINNYSPIERAKEDTLFKSIFIDSNDYKTMLSEVPLYVTDYGKVCRDDKYYFYIHYALINVAKMTPIGNDRLIVEYKILEEKYDKQDIYDFSYRHKSEEELRDEFIQEKILKEKRR